MWVYRARVVALVSAALAAFVSPSANVHCRVLGHTINRRVSVNGVGGPSPPTRIRIVNPRRRFRSALALAAAAVVLIVAGAVFVKGELVSHPGYSVAEASPIPTPIQKTSVACLSPAIVLTGAINGCAGVLEGMSCPKGPYDATRVVHLRGSGNDYILYVEVDGGYHGPGTYPLTPWKTDGLNAGDGVAKVAVRQWNGVLWESFSGSLGIDSTEEGGDVEASLRLPGSASILHIHGPWTCP